MINFNNIFVFVVFCILLIGLVYSRALFMYFIYFSIIICFIWGLFKLSKQKIKIRDFTLNSFNRSGSNDASSFMWILLSIAGFTFFYSNYGFPSF